MSTADRTDDWGRPYGTRIMGRRGAIASDHYLSAQAGMDILRAGGNAFDAAVAAALVESVVNPHMFTLGGECAMLLYEAGARKVIAVNGSTVAPARARIGLYRARGLDHIPPEGVLAAGVPTALSALVEVLIHHGSCSFGQVVEEAHRLCADGFPVHEGLVSMPRFSISACRNKFVESWPESAGVYLTAAGEVPEVGEFITNTALADVFQALTGAELRRGEEHRRKGLEAVVDEFYRGDVAVEIASYVREQKGLMEADDLTRFQARLEEPSQLGFRDTTVFKCGPWSQGPVFLQMLALYAAGAEQQQLEHNSVDYIHFFIEAAKLAYADREQYYGDPEKVPVPIEGLLSTAYNLKRTELISWNQASGLHVPGDPQNGIATLPLDEILPRMNWGHGTVSVNVIDSQGNMAALAASGGRISENGLMPYLGFPLSTRLHTFSLDPHHPNSLAPGKRPRTAPSPCLALRGGEPWMVFGTMGDDYQDQWTCQFFLNRALFGMSLQEAIEAPKVSCAYFPASSKRSDDSPKQVRAEGRISEAALDELRHLGHEIQTVSGWEVGCIGAVARESGDLLVAGVDPRCNKTTVFPAQALAW